MENNKYLIWYNHLIERARNREKLVGIYYEKHHIIPKSIGGEDVDSNYAYLTAREHIIAHMLLVKIYAGNKKLIYALNAMTLNKVGGRVVTEHLTTRQIAKIREEAAKARIGTKMPKSFSQKIAIANSKRVWTPESRRKSSESQKKIKNRKTDHLIKFEKRHVPWNKGKSMPLESIEKLKESRKHLSDEAHRNYSEAAKKRGFCGPTKKVMDPKGVIFKSTAACAREYKVSDGTIRNWIKKSPEKGFKYVD